jgi:hypothetical protein
MTQFVCVRLKGAALVLAGCTAVAMPGDASAQTATKTAEPPQPKVLAVSPATVPVSALKYRLSASATRWKSNKSY